MALLYTVMTELHLPLVLNCYSIDSVFMWTRRRPYHYAVNSEEIKVRCVIMFKINIWFSVYL